MNIILVETKLTAVQSAHDPIIINNFPGKHSQF